MDDIQRLKLINDQNAHKAAEDAKHHDLVDAQLKTQQVVLQSFSSLIDYLDNKVTKAEVINQLESIGTPDVAHVVSALNGIHETLAQHKESDISGLTNLMKEALEAARNIPHESIEFPEQIDYSKQFTSLTDAIKAVEEVVKAQKLSVAAPIVNVPEAQVNVDAPDLSPLEKHLKDVTKAVKGIVIPEYKTDNKEVEKLLTKANKTLEKILDRPVGGGGGGGGGTYIPLVDDMVVTTTATLATRLDDTSTTNMTYVGKANPGSLPASAVWQISRIDETTGLIITYADGDDNFNNIWNNRTGLSYS